MDRGREAHHGVLGAKVVDHEGTTNSPRNIEQTVEKSINWFAAGSLVALLDNGRPTKHNTQ